MFQPPDSSIQSRPNAIHNFEGLRAQKHIASLHWSVCLGIQECCGSTVQKEKKKIEEEKKKPSTKKPENQLRQHKYVFRWHRRITDHGRVA